MIAVDDLIDRAREAKTRAADATKEHKALVGALEGLRDAGLLDAAQKRALSHIGTAKRRRQTPRAPAAAG